MSRHRTEDYLRAAHKAGLEIRKSKNGRYKVYSPDKREILYVNSKWEYERNAERVIQKFLVKFGVVLTIILLAIAARGGLP